VKKSVASEPVRSLVLDAPGAPGHRTFYLQAQLSSGDRTTILLEKAQAMIIVEQIDALLNQITSVYPATPAAAGVSAQPAQPAEMVETVEMALHQPEPVLFRAGQFALQYDPDRALVRFRVSELRGVDQGAPQVCLWWVTRQQLSALGEMTRRVLRRGLDRDFAAQTE
jgi:uncharacterized repeat protein (TIGR03847 family)